MTARCSYILAGLLIASCFCLAEAGADLSIAEYRAQLDQLLVSAQQLDSSGRSVPQNLLDLPQSWRIHTEEQDFTISAEGLRTDVHKFTQEGDFSSASAIRSRIQSLRDDVDGFEKSPHDVSNSREHLTAILARREFRDVSGPTFFDRLVQRLLAFVIRMLGLLFRSSAIPTVSKFFVYGLDFPRGIGSRPRGLPADLVGSEQESFVPAGVPVSAKSWALWLAEAQAAAKQHNWREAIHLAYWAGISFLERQGTWRPDRARTPREYLKLMSNASEHRETLAALTRVFELAWYAKREADAEAFAQTLKALERLGCHSKLNPKDRKLMLGAGLVFVLLIIAALVFGSGEQSQVNFPAATRPRPAAPKLHTCFSPIRDTRVQRWEKSLSDLPLAHAKNVNRCRTERSAHSRRAGAAEGFHFRVEAMSSLRECLPARSFPRTSQRLTFSRP
jgi:hypothetical protein